MKTAVLALVLALFGSACATTDVANAPEPQLQMVFQITEIVRGGDARFEISIRNDGDHPVRLDARLLSVALMAEIKDDAGNEVPRIPLSLQIPFHTKHIVKIAARDRLILTDNLSGIVSTSFLPQIRAVRFCYNSESQNYPRWPKVWRGKLCSNTLPRSFLDARARSDQRP